MELGADCGAGLREGQHLGFQGRAGIEPIPAPVPSSPWHGCCALITLTSPVPCACHSASSSPRDPVAFFRSHPGIMAFPSRESPSQARTIIHGQRSVPEPVPHYTKCSVLPVGRRLEAQDVGKGKLSGFRIRIPSQDIQDNGTGDRQCHCQEGTSQQAARGEDTELSQEPGEGGKLRKSSGKV